MPRQSYASIFDPSIHKPPRIDHWGYNKETHKGRELLNRNAKNILNETVSVPTWWTNKMTKDKRFADTDGFVKSTSSKRASDVSRSV